MKYFSHKCIIKCVRNKTQESIILIHLNTFVTTLKSTWRKLISSFTCGDPFRSTGFESQCKECTSEFYGFRQRRVRRVHQPKSLAQEGSLKVVEYLQRRHRRR
jgi:hypothetical protein